MTLALTKIQAYGVEAVEPVFKRHTQLAILTMTGANTDVTYDFGTYAGTFWTAVGATEPGTSALKFFKDVAIRALCFADAESVELATRTTVTEAVKVLSSAASAGGAATEALTVTGLATTDVILALTQRVKGANSTALNGWSTQILNGVTASWTGNPGAGSIVDVAFMRPAATPDAGQYSISFSNLSPIITFKTADAPTSWNIVLRWVLKEGEEPLELYKSA